LSPKKILFFDSTLWYKKTIKDPNPEIVNKAINNFSEETENKKKKIQDKINIEARRPSIPSIIFIIFIKTIITRIVIK
jgi:hypothetical protein